MQLSGKLQAKLFPRLALTIGQEVQRATYILNMARVDSLSLSLVSCTTEIPLAITSYVLSNWLCHNLSRRQALKVRTARQVGVLARSLAFVSSFLQVAERYK